MTPLDLAVIGGSGLYKMPGLEDVREEKVDTPFGPPSDVITRGRLHGREVAFVPRHGRGHVLSPSEVPYRANMYALKALGARYVVAVSACGSLREAMAPGHFVIPDQLFDHTKGLRDMTFFEDGLVAHVSVATPFSSELSAAVADAARSAGANVHEGGAFITIEGPRFSTRVESQLFRSWGLDIIGMTTSPEAYLAAEAEMAYACLAHVTDYDVWHESEAPVTVEMVIRTVQGNTARAQSAIGALVGSMADWDRPMAAHDGLRDAFITSPGAIDPAARERLALLVDRYLA